MATKPKRVPTLKVGEAPPRPSEGKRYTLFRKHGAKYMSANIVMPNGHEEIFDTHQTIPDDAATAAATRVRMLYKELGIETPAAIRKRTGELSPYQKRKRAIQGASESPLPSGPLPIKNGAPAPVEAPDDGQWAQDVAKIEDKFAKAFYRIQGLLLIGGADDPLQFREHVRAIVIEATMGAMTKTRAPWGPRKVRR